MTSGPQHAAILRSELGLYDIMNRFMWTAIAEIMMAGICTYRATNQGSRKKWPGFFVDLFGERA
jgi:hypothetical protein